MSLATTELVTLYSGRETEVIRAKTIAAMFCGRNYQSELQRAYTVQVPTRNNTVAATAHTRGANWKTLQEADISLAAFTIDQSSEVGNVIRYEDFIESPLDLVMTVADDQGYAHAQRMNTHIWTTMLAAVPAANTSDVGDATNYLPLDGDQKGNNTTNVKTQLDAIWYEMMAANLLFTGERDYQPFVVLGPGHWRHFIGDEIEAARSTPDLIGLDTTREGRLLPNNPMSVGRYRGMNIIVDPTVPTATVSSKVYSQILAGVTAATEFANREPVVQFLTPQTNQTAPNYAMRSVRQYKAQVVQSALLWRRRFRTEA